MKALHITQWDTLYETWETRKLRNLTFYAKPNKLVGLGIGRTLEHARGLEFLGVWALLEALASLAPQGQRGWLARNGTPMTTLEIAYLLRVPEEPVEAAVKHFLNREIGWLEEKEFDLAGVQTPGDHPDVTRRISGEPPAGVQTPGRSTENLLTISARGKRKDIRGKRDKDKKEKENGGFADPGQARSAQAQQFAAADSRKRDLEGIPEDERTEEQWLELKKMRGLCREIQRRQTRGDFTPVVAEAA